MSQDPFQEREAEKYANPADLVEKNQPLYKLLLVE